MIYLGAGLFGFDFMFGDLQLADGAVHRYKNVVGASEYPNSREQRIMRHAFGATD